MQESSLERWHMNEEKRLNRASTKERMSAIDNMTKIYRLSFARQNFSFCWAATSILLAHRQSLTHVFLTRLPMKEKLIEFSSANISSHSVKTTRRRYVEMRKVFKFVREEGELISFPSAKDRKSRLGREERSREKLLEHVGRVVHEEMKLLAANL